MPIVETAQGYVIRNPKSGIVGTLVAVLFGLVFAAGGIWVLMGAGGMTADWPNWVTLLAGICLLLFGGAIAYVTIAGGRDEVLLDPVRKQLVFCETRSGRQMEQDSIDLSDIQSVYLAGRNDHSADIHEVRMTEIVYIRLYSGGKDRVVFAGRLADAERVAALISTAVAAA